MYGLIFYRGAELHEKQCLGDRENWLKTYAVADPTDEFWKAWRADKFALKDEGFEVSQCRGTWVVLIRKETFEAKHEYSQQVLAQQMLLPI